MEAKEWEGGCWKYLAHEWRQVDARWTLREGGGGRGPHSNNVPDSTIELFIARRDLKRSLDSTSLVRNLLTDLLHTNF